MRKIYETISILMYTKFPRYTLVCIYICTYVVCTVELHVKCYACECEYVLSFTYCVVHSQRQEERKKSQR